MVVVVVLLVQIYWVEILCRTTCKASYNEHIRPKSVANTFIFSLLLHLSMWAKRLIEMGKRAFSISHPPMALYQLLNVSFYFMLKEKRKQKESHFVVNLCFGSTYKEPRPWMMCVCFSDYYKIYRIRLRCEKCAFSSIKLPILATKWFNSKFSFNILKANDLTQIQTI